MNNKSYVPLLEELTARLSQAPADNPPNELIIGYEGCPPMIGRALYKTLEIGIMQCFLPEGHVLPMHRHEQKEWIICFHGKIKFTTEESTQIMEAGSCRFMKAGEAHESLALEDSKTIVITIPTDPGFPDVR